jgi:hypothetical protein
MKSHQNFGIGLICLGLFIAVVAAITIGPGLLTGTHADQQETSITQSGENKTVEMTVTTGMTLLTVTPDNATKTTPSTTSHAPFITIDPISDKNTGDLVIISGTTNLPPRTSVYLKEMDESTGESTIRANKVVCPGIDGVNRWTFAFDSTASMKPGSHRYIVSTPKGNATGSVQFTLKGTFLGPEKILYYQSSSNLATISGTGTPFIVVNPIGDRQKGDIFRVSGTTNLIEGTVLSCTIWPAYFEDKSKRPAIPSDDPCDGQWYAMSVSTAVVKGTGDTNRWSFAVDTTIAEKTEMIVHVSTVNEDFSKKEIYGNTTFNLK